MNNQQAEYIKLFLNKCKIVMTTFDDLDGLLLPREILLDVENYKIVKDEIGELKQMFNSSSLTALQSTAEDNQKWPLLNLVRQILKACNFKMTPKRISAGYTKEGTKLYKRMFIIERFTAIESSIKIIDDKLEDNSYLLYIWNKFKLNKLGVIGLIGIISLMFIAIFAPVIANSVPLCIIGSMRIEFPFIYYIFSPNSPEILVAKVFNYLMLFITLGSLSFVCLKRKKKIMMYSFCLISLVLLIPFISVRKVFDKTDWESKSKTLSKDNK
jgi:hypothetical protein